MNRQENRAFLRNTICYFIPFLIMTALALVSLGYTFSMLMKQNYEIVQTQLQRGTDDIEEKLSVLTELATKIGMDREINRKDMEEQSVAATKAIQKLVDYKMEVEFCSRLFWTYTPDKLIASDGLSSRDVFTHTIYKMTEESRQLFGEMFEQRRHISRVLEVDGGRKYILYLYYYPKSTYISERWVGFMMDAQKILAEYQHIVGDLDTYLLMTYGGTVVCEAGSFDGVLSEETLKDIQKLQAGEIQSFAGYTVMANECKSQDLDIYVFLNNQMVTRALRNEQVKLFSISITAFFLLSLFLWLYGKRNYKKLHLVKTLAARMYPEVNGKGIKGEYEIIQTVLEKNIERFHEHDQRIEYFRKESINQLTWLLVNCAPPKELQIEELLESYGVETSGFYYGVLNLLITKECKNIDVLNNIPRVMMYCQDKRESEIILIVVVKLNSRDELHSERLALSETILAELSEVGCSCEGITFGLVYEQIEEIHSSQDEARSLFSMLIEEKGQKRMPLLFFDEIAQTSKRVPHLTTSLLQEFKASLYDKRQKEALKQLSALLAPPKDMAQDLLTYVRYKILQSMMDVFQSEGISGERVNKLMSLIDFEGDEFKKEVKGLIEELCAKREDKTIDVQQVLDFIEEHALDGEISMNSVANYLGISERTVSRVVKEKLNKTYKEYITEVRMKKACELLLEGKLGIQSIAMCVGYYNVTSFNRLFKQVYGVSPSEYRSNTKK